MTIMDRIALDLPPNAWERGTLVNYRGTVYVIWADPNRGGLFHLSYPEAPGMPVLWSIPWTECHPI